MVFGSTTQTRKAAVKMILCLKLIFTVIVFNDRTVGKTIRPRFATLHRLHNCDHNTDVVFPKEKINLRNGSPQHK